MADDKPFECTQPGCGMVCKLQYLTKTLLVHRLMKLPAVMLSARADLTILYACSM